MRKIKYITSLILIHSTVFAQNTTPPLNQKILDYVTSVVGKKVTRGECWDLANEALTKFNAKWDGNFKYGKLLNPLVDEIYSGDLIQFENVVMKYEKDGRHYKESMAHHTAIVYRVIAKGEYQIAHQNTGQHGRKVGISEFKLSDMTKGKVLFYRPEAN